MAGTYTDTKNGFSISGPEGWRTDRSGRQRTSVIFLAPKVDKNFRPNLTVTVQNIGKATLADYIEASKQAAAKLPGGKLDKQDEIMLGGQKGAYLRYSYSDGGLALRSVAFFVVVNEKAYVITGTAPAETYETYRLAFLNAARSFALN
jgi:hypothetical protein